MSLMSPVICLLSVAWFCRLGCQRGFERHQVCARLASSKVAFAVGLVSSLKDGGGGRSALSGIDIQGSYGGGSGSFC